MIEHMLVSMERENAKQITAPLAAVVDGLLDLDPDTLGDAELADAVVQLHRQQARFAAAVTGITEAADARRDRGDDGSRSCGAWVAHRCRRPVGQARGEVWLGRRLRTMPATAEAFAAGDISLRHAMVAASLADGRSAEYFTRDEAILVDDARTLSWADFVRAAEYWRQHAGPDGVERDADHDHAWRRVHLSPGLRGTGILDGLLTPLGYATVNTALRRIEQELFEARLGGRPRRARRCRHRMPSGLHPPAAAPRRLGGTSQARGGPDSVRPSSPKGPTDPTAERAHWSDLPPQLLGGQRGSLGQRPELRPHDRRVHLRGVRGAG